MKKLMLIQNPELFQGKKFLKRNKVYFEGWYFKNTTQDESISFIPGININDKEKKAFIQIISNSSSYYINYDIDDFKFNEEPFYIKVGDNFFSKDCIRLNIKDASQKLKIYGEINYSYSKNISNNFFNPNIMGPFSYLSFMECNHAIISMKSVVNGKININDYKIEFNDDIGYIEKDWGCSFPKYYIWCQGNDFKNNRASFMLSIADIPFKFFNFRGLICSLIIDNEEYRFATYNGTKIIKYEVNDKYFDISLKNASYNLDVKSEYFNASKLKAPIKGKMERDILESICASISVILKKDNKIIFSDISNNCGLEIVIK